MRKPWTQARKVPIVSVKIYIRVSEEHCTPRSHKTISLFVPPIHVQLEGIRQIFIYRSEDDRHSWNASLLRHTPSEAESARCTTAIHRWSYRITCPVLITRRYLFTFFSSFFFKPSLLLTQRPKKKFNFCRQFFFYSFFSKGISKGIPSHLPPNERRGCILFCC